MLRITATFDLTMLYLVAAIVIAILVYTLVIRRRARRIQQHVDDVRTAIVDFFRKSGEQVSVKCIEEDAGRKFVALIDSLPSKRFRYSHVVGIVLANHVYRTCGLELERVYWRFPIKAIREDMPEPSSLAEELAAADAYLDAGRSRLRELPRYEVTEASWVNFEELAGHKEAVA